MKAYVHVILQPIFELTMACIENSMDLDQVSSSEAIWSVITWFTTEFVSGFILFLKNFTVLEQRSHRVVVAVDEGTK